MQAVCDDATNFAFSQVHPSITPLCLMTSRPSPHYLHDTVCFQTVLSGFDLDHTKYTYFVYLFFPLDLGFIRWFPASVSEQKSKRANKFTFNSIIGNLYPAETCHRGLFRNIPCAGGHQCLADGTRWPTEKTSDGITVSTASAPASESRTWGSTLIRKEGAQTNGRAGSRLSVLGF